MNRVTILTDRIGNAKGYAYIEFEKADAAVSAVLLDNTELRGRQIKVCSVHVTKASQCTPHPHEPVVVHAAFASPAGRSCHVLKDPLQTCSRGFSLISVHVSRAPVRVKSPSGDCLLAPCSAIVPVGCMS